LWPCSVRVWTLLHDSDIDIMPLQLPAELPLMTLLSSVMFALDTPLPNSSSSPLTTMFLSPCVFTLSPSHSHLFTLPKVKRKNDHTVLKYGSSLYFFFSFFLFFLQPPFLVEAPNPMVRSPSTRSVLLHSRSTRLRIRENWSPLPYAIMILPKSPNWSVLFIPPHPTLFS